MASTFSIISTVFLTTGVLFIMQGIALVVLYVIKWRGGAAHAAKGDDHANMMILFQSMRDLLDEQKRLARQLNEDIDRKLTRINLVVHDALDSVQHPAPRPSAPVRPAYRPPARAESERDARAAFLKAAKQVVTPPAEGAADSPSNSRKSERIGHEPPAAQPADPPEAFRAVAEDEPGTGPTGEKFDAWVGLDFGDDAPNPYRVEVPEQPPAAPEDAEKAREAFRSLLDLHHETGHVGGNADPASSAKTAARPPAAGDTNGARKLTPLQRRVQEYADAGMSVPQISRELGIGKGEVRLILSLREGRTV